MPLQPSHRRRQISIHALRGEGDGGLLLRGRDRLHFNPHPPWGGRRASIRTARTMVTFQSTPSVGRATRINQNRANNGNISIHTLRGEGDVIIDCDDGAVWLNFNPHPPWGGRQKQWALKTKKSIFQSTPSVGRATSHDSKARQRNGYFNPHPPWGGRLQRL